MSNTDENLNDIEEKVEEKKDENLDTFEVESNTEKVSNTNNTKEEIVEKSDIQFEDLIKERDELKDKLMRSLAESENIRKRAFKDRQDAETYAVSRMSRDPQGVQCV